MRSYYVLMVALTALPASSNVAVTDASKTPISNMVSPSTPGLDDGVATIQERDTAKRMLKVSKKADDGLLEERDDEERGFINDIKFSTGSRRG
ncbi:unnamed protein product [Phytophthora lilii]|uniref:RxLR effector protein n=1 Tax=Phytophthora lilii TaxID=2077276 RepID=A0A9W6XI58_9STRA|nr:unnamed protein product [Phytophthora lilii]